VPDEETSNGGEGEQGRLEQHRREEAEHRDRLRQAEAHADETLERAEQRLEEVERRTQARKERLRDALPPPDE
jgi:hypothetical protein